MEQAFEFVKSEPEAVERARLFKSRDPFPYVPQALLSSVEIFEYVRVTGMLYPFYPEGLKSASYEAHLGGRCIFWDEKEKCHDQMIKRGQPFTLPANSIVFFEVEPTFRIPNYIALRFNLRITHVHRGLLLGTGPLVDPGFNGRLLIPLHNLTDSDYPIDTDKALIWIDFTKTTFGLQWPEQIDFGKRLFVDFPEEKTNLKPENYLQKANKGNPIRSSISGSIQEIRQKTEKATKTAEQAELYFKKIAWGAVIAITVAIASIIMGGYSLLMDANTLSGSLSTSVGALSEENENLKGQIIDLKEKFKAIEGDTSIMEDRLKKVEDHMVGQGI